MNRLKKIATLLLIALATLTTSFLVLPTHAAPLSDSHSPFLDTQTPTRVPTPIGSNATESLAATRPGRCEVPPLWWYLGEQRFAAKCKKKQRETGTLTLTPHLSRSGLMSLFVEWRFVGNGKIRFRCMGPISYFYDTDNLVPHTYAMQSKPGINLHSVHIRTAPYAWLGLDISTSSACDAP